MRLIKTTTLQLKFFTGDVPPYVILSHTWGEEEVTFQNMEDGPEPASKLKGFAKIRDCCRQAVRDGYEWAWVDTCCIDKTSSSELSEAINSMYRWYELSAVCYVWMEDVEAAPNALATDPPSVAGRQPPAVARRSLGYEFSRSRWFKRGWTLQELIAPRCLEFYDRHWREIGTKLSLAAELRRITRIRADVLAGGPMAQCCMAERMSWAANRETTKIEDRAYSLLGIFDVNMPLLYGEGTRAFIRLQEEILRRHEDLSLLAWNIPALPDYHSVLAPEPRGFTSVLATHNAPAGRDERSPDRIQQGIIWENVHGVPLTKFEAPSITSRGILVTLFIDTPASHNVSYTPGDVLAWTNLIAKLGAPQEPAIRLCMMMRTQPRSIGSISDFPDYTTLERPSSYRQLGMICVSQHAATNFVPKKFYLPTQVEALKPSTEWAVKQAWSIPGVSRTLLGDLGGQTWSDLNVLTFRLDPGSGITLAHHYPGHLNRAETRPGVYSVLIPAGGAATSMTRKVLFSCSQSLRGPGGRVTVDRFVVYFTTATGKETNLLCGCSLLGWTAEVDERGLAAKAVTDLERKQSSTGFPFGDRAHFRLQDGAVVAAAVKQHVQSVRGNKSFANVSLNVSVTREGVSPGEN